MSEALALSRVVPADSPSRRDPRLAAYLPLVRKMAWRYHRQTGGHQDLEDLEQLALIALWYAIDSYKDDRGMQFGSWATMVLRQTMMDVRVRVRRKKHIPWMLQVSVSPREEDDLPELELSGPLPTAESLLDHRRRYLPLYRAIGELAEKQRLVIEHRFFWDETLKETGEALGFTRERARQLEAEALQVLRRKLSPLKTQRPEMPMELEAC